ncbi:MAG TPA: ABC transporter permease [Gemmatimonadaceae bacterium]|jgi:predicted permease|nr:ABC transporter permease [Gemmatimonadaceae bacterium]
MFGRRSQRDFEDEVHAHLDMEIDRLKAQGMSPVDAERAARRNFGNVGVAEDRFYHGQRFAWAEDAMRDLRHAWRSLLRTPAFLAATVGTLALAIGAVAGMFDVVNTVMLRPLPYPNPERLVFLFGTAPGSDLPNQFGLGNEFYVHYKENSKLISGVFTFSGGTSTFRTGDRVERIPMSWATNDMYTTLGVRPQLGRLPVASDNDDAVVLSDELWSTWFARNPSVIGKWFFVSDSMKQVIGVMPREFHFPDEHTMLWISGEVRPGQVRTGEFGGPLVARMKDGVTRQQLETELTGLAQALPARFGGSALYTSVIKQYRSIVTPLLEGMVGSTLATSLWILLGAVGVVLLIACANVANLFLVRAESRRRDLTVRRAIGASRAQLARFQMAEAFAVALAAGVLAVILAEVTLPLFLRAAPQDIPRLGEAAVDAPTLATAFGVVVLVALVCGGVPALRASSPDLAGLREGGRGSTGQRAWGRNLLVVGQTALALVLVIGAALLVESFQRLRHVNPGYDIRDIYTFQFAPDQPGLRDGPSLGRMHLAFMNRLRALPGVTTVGVVNNIPLDEGTPTVRVRAEDMAGDAQPLLLHLNFAGGDVFKALGVPVVQGRTFTNDEAVAPNTSAILSRSAAEKLWPGQNALGRRIRPRFGNQDTLTFTVVGVVGDVKQNDWREDSQATAYFPLTGPTVQAWGMGSPAYVVKSTRADQLKREVRSLVHDIAPEAPVYREFTMEFLTRRSMIQLSFTMLTLGIVSALALLLGVVGLYGVLSYVVAQRTREIGVRMALGATAAAVLKQVVGQGTRVVLVGVIIGLAAALAATRLLGTLLYGVKAVDPVMFTAMAIAMIGMGVLASYMPARRASAVDPMEALRSD